MRVCDTYHLSISDITTLATIMCLYPVSSNILSSEHVNEIFLTTNIGDEFSIFVSLQHIMKLSFH